MRVRYYYMVGVLWGMLAPGVTAALPLSGLQGHYTYDRTTWQCFQLDAPRIAALMKRYKILACSTGTGPLPFSAGATPRAGVWHECRTGRAPLFVYQSKADCSEEAATEAANGGD